MEHSECEKHFIGMQSLSAGARNAADALGRCAMRSGLRIVGSQAFHLAPAFNADISRWNTASLTYLVCAASGRRRATASDALGWGSMRRDQVCGGTWRARVWV